MKDLTESLTGDKRVGATILQSVLEEPSTAIAANAGRDAAAVIERIRSSDRDVGFDARDGKFCNMFDAGIIDPVAVPVTALRNAVSVAALILTTQTLIAKRAEYVDPTAGPAMGGGAERLGHA